MKKLLIISLLIVPIIGLSQIKLAKPEDFRAFSNSRTLVVSHEDPFSNYNDVIKENLKLFWEITNHEFIPFKEFKTKKNNRKYSFIILTEAKRESQGREYIYNILNLILGGRASSLDKMSDLGSVPLSYLNVPEESYIYKIGGMLQFMQYYVRYNLKYPKSDIKKLIRENANEISSKELWLLKEELAQDINSIEKIKKIYPYSCRIVTKDDIKKAIENKNDKVIFLHKVGPESTINGGECWKFIISAGDGRPVYFSRHEIDREHPDAFLLNDFKKLGKR